VHLPVISNRPIDLILFQQFQNKFCFLNCLFYRDCLRKEINTGFRPLLSPVSIQMYILSGCSHMLLFSLPSM
jgi:hypothetical protein